MGNIVKTVCLSCLCLAVAHGEVMLFSTEHVEIRKQIEVPLPEGAVRAKDYANGKLVVCMTVDAPWTMEGRDENAIRLKGASGEYLTTTKAPWHDYGELRANTVFKLEFPLPEKPEPLTFIIPAGITQWSKTRPEVVAIWTGPKLEGHAVVDNMNRNCIVALTDLGEEAESYEFTFPGRIVKGKSATARFRLKGRKEPFKVVCKAYLTDGMILERTFDVVPHETIMQPPLKEDELLVGVCVYRASNYKEKRVKENPEGWKRYPRSQEEEISGLIEEGGVNLIVPWYNPPVESVAAAAEKGIYTMTIYQYLDAEKCNAYRAAGKNRFWLNNNIGEYASYLYQNEQCLPKGVNQHGDLEFCREHFINNYIRSGVEHYHRGYPYIFSTSGSTVSNYEMAGGVEFMLCELYALGAMNLAWASAEMRGASRKWLPEFWGGWLAAEWQSTSVPYLAPQKYGMLRVGLYQQYLMGSHIIILESGSQSTQAGEYTVPLNKDDEFPHRDYNCDESPVQNYKKEMVDFHKFVKANPRSKGTPATTMASVLGNCGSYCGLYIDWFAAFSQHAQAKTNPNWLYGDPERTDVAVQQTIFPVPQDALAPYTNYWIGGSPYGQCDVVNIDDETDLDDLKRYEFLFYGGWNTMTDTIMRTLRSYVENGGSLFISLPHFSTRKDREFRNFTKEDLINGGDLTALCDIRVKGRRVVSGQFLTKRELDDRSKTDFDLHGGVKDEPMADVVLGPNVEEIATVGSCPLLVRQPIGKGDITVMLSWEYPGKESLAASYKTILGWLANQHAGKVRVFGMNEQDKTPQYISYAVWPEAIYLLNTDCMRSRTFFLERNGRRVKMTLQPMEFKIVK